MKVSILTPTFNRCETFLPQCVESVRRQYGAVDYEHLVVDDRSTDDTWTWLLEQSAIDQRLLPLQTDANGGPARALNVALAHATGTYVLPLDDDDLLLPWSVQSHANFLSVNSDVDLSFGWAVLTDAATRLDLWSFEKYGVDLEAIQYSDDHAEFLEIMWAHNSVFNSTAIVRRAAANAVGGWDENVSCQDWAMWLSLLEAGHKHRRNPSYLSCYRVHDRQLTVTHSEDGTYKRDEDHLRRRFGRPGRVESGE